ncbi:MAG: hypothetical protein KC646_02745 [Candidatus Cloacimonetes bacterium]|nr:hypothetical protein [Candidatus Cloacimonadota bacterium]
MRIFLIAISMLIALNSAEARPNKSNLGSKDIEVLKARVQKNKLARKIRKGKRTNKGLAVFYLMHEWHDKAPKTIKIEDVTDPRFEGFTLNLSLKDSFVTRVDKVEKDINPVAVAAFGFLGAALTRGNKKRKVRASVYVGEQELDAGTYNFRLSYNASQGRKRKKKDLRNTILKDIKIEAGKVSLVDWHWGEAKHFTIKDAPSKAYFKAMKTNLAMYLPYLQDYEVVNSLDKPSISVKLDMDYKERGHATRPRVWITKAFLAKGQVTIEGLPLFEKVKAFGGGMDRYTHSYYEVKFPIDKLQKGACYDMVLEGYSLLDYSDKKVFEPKGKITEKKLLCIDRLSDFQVKVVGNRVTGSTWKLELKQD